NERPFDATLLQLFEHAGTEMEPGRWRSNGARLPREDRLVARPVVGHSTTFSNIAWQRHLAVGCEQVERCTELAGPGPPGTGSRAAHQVKLQAPWFQDK